ncbi:MAG: type III-A CRISPR-associated RAMP protein Csm3 [Chlorobi bacterium]|nr:type III-A CRISPR-associated RAMP protein Csm3 [Chlorobiota bacterium]
MNDNNKKETLVKKIFLKGEIQILTGIHIGGNSSSIEIGGVDNDIVKTGNSVPLIPGSSLKGKLRSLLAKVEGSSSVIKDSDLLKKMFGGTVSDRFTTRFLIRDAHLNLDHFNQTFGDKKDRKLDLEYSEIKTENAINRLKGSAEHPRQMERVPAFAKFNVNIVLNVLKGDDTELLLKKLSEAITLLNMDYLGGNGSRGYGEVNFVINEISGKNISKQGIHSISVDDINKYLQIFNS